MLGISCIGCELKHQEAGNCALFGRERDVDQPVIYIKYTDTEYYNCPISLIPTIIYDLWDEYRFLQEFNCVVTKHDMSNILWWFIKTYQRIKNDIDIKQHDEQMKKHKIKT